MNKIIRLMELIVRDIVMFLIEDKGISTKEAINMFYASEVFEKLHDVDTGLYLESAAYVYELLKSEFKEGRINQ